MLITNSSALIVPAPSPATNGAAVAPVFQEAPKPLIYIPDTWAWVFWAVVILALLAALYFAWRWWRRKPAVVTPPIPPHVRARRKLEQALAMIGEPKPFSILVSGAIREYLEERFNFRAPERTTDEFLCELQGSFLLTRDQKRSLAEFLASCDLIKFAKYEPTEMELRGLYQSALRLVNETEPRPVPANTPPPVPNIPPGAPPADVSQSAIRNPQSNDLRPPLCSLVVAAPPGAGLAQGQVGAKRLLPLFLGGSGPSHFRPEQIVGGPHSGRPALAGPGRLCRGPGTAASSSWRNANQSQRH
jgi:hypothetical protein